MCAYNRQRAFHMGGHHTGLQVGGHVENTVVHYCFTEHGKQLPKTFVPFLQDLKHEVRICNKSKICKKFMTAFLK